MQGYIAFVYGAAGRWIAYGAILSMLGAIVFRFVVLHRVRKIATGNVDWIDDTASRAARVGLVAAVAAIAATGWRLYAQAYSIFGVDEGVTLEGVRIVVGQTQWGTGWMLQTAAATLAMVGFMWATSRPKLGWIAAAIGAAATAVTIPLTGHAVSQLK